MPLDPQKQMYVIGADASVEEAWSRIEINRHRSVIVVDDEKTVGTLSDGDIRKAMLSRRILSTPVREIMNTNFLSLQPHEAGAAGERFIERDIFLIPVVDEEMNLLDVIAR